MKSAIKILNSLTAIMLIICLSCGDNTKKEQHKETQSVKQLDVIKNTTGTIGNAISLMDTQPISYEELELWFPEELLMMQRTNLEKGALSDKDISGAVANYEGPDGSSFKITINDGAGKNGSIIIGSFSIYKNMSVDMEDDYKLEKSFKKDGMAGIETFYKKKKECQMKFMYADRFAMTIISKQLERETVWNAIETLNLEKLTKNN